MSTPPYPLPNLPLNPASRGTLPFPSAWPALPGGCLSSFPRERSSAPRCQCHYLKMSTQPTDREQGWDPLLLVSAAKLQHKNFFTWFPSQLPKIWWWAQSTSWISRGSSPFRTQHTHNVGPSSTQVFCEVPEGLHKPYSKNKWEKHQLLLYSALTAAAKWSYINQAFE